MHQLAQRSAMLADFLQLDTDEREGKFPFIWAVDAKNRLLRLLVTEDLVLMLNSMGLDTGIDLGKLLAVRPILSAALPDEPLYGFTPDAGLPLGFPTSSART
mgnify:CR=1 FL=1